MTTQTLAQAPSTPKASPHAANKNAVNRNKSNEGATFENELNEASEPSAAAENQESQVLDLSLLLEGDELLDLTNTTATNEPIQTLFPSQLAIQVIEAPKEESSAESLSDGVIFSTEENKSTSTGQVIAKALTSEMHNELDLSATDGLAETVTQASGGNSILSAESANTTLSGSATPANSKVLDLLASLNKATSSDDKDLPVDLNSLNANSGESLKSSTTQAKPESITLNPQHRLEKVLDSVFEEAPLPTPRRIEVKLQTPQGAQITLYIARVNQELRAQFSANSHQAMAWLQSEIKQLRGINSTEAIRWLPAQMESAVAKTENSEKSSDEKSEEDRKRDDKTSVESIFDLFKPSTRRLA